MTACIILQETEDDEDDDSQMVMNGDASRDLRYDDDDLMDPVNVSCPLFLKGEKLIFGFDWLIDFKVLNGSLKFVQRPPEPF